MIFRLYIGNWRFTFSFMQVEKVVGINSRVKGGGHILMWDFDSSTGEQVVKELKRIQRKYKLPPIYVLKTKEDGHFIAYCFKRVEFQDLIKILADTKGICLTFLRATAWRFHATLRVSPKSGRKPIPYAKLDSDVRPDVNLKDIEDWTLYETMTDNCKKGIVEFGRRCKDH